MAKKTVIVLTGGGLAPALNPTLYGVITAARKQGYRVLGGVAGWLSLLEDGRRIDLSNVDVESIRNMGGTFLRSSRTNPFKVAGGVDAIKATLNREGIDAIIAIGGNDTLGAARELARKEGIPAVGIPKTIDNDLSGTYWCPGFPSAAHYISSFVREIREDAAYALQRIYVIEALGMHSGWLAASGSYGGADVIIPPEKTVSLQSVLKITQRRYRDNDNFAAVVVAQEAQFDEPLGVSYDDQHDQYSTKRQQYIALSLRAVIAEKLGITTRMLYPGNYFETGAPIPVDRDYAIQLGTFAVGLVRDGHFGTMASLRRPDARGVQLEVVRESLDEVVGEDKLRKLPPGMFDYKKLRVTQKFFDYMEPALGKYAPPDSDYHRLLTLVRKGK